MGIGSAIYSTNPRIRGWIWISEQRTAILASLSSRDLMSNNRKSLESSYDATSILYAVFLTKSGKSSDQCTNQCKDHWLPIVSIHNVARYTHGVLVFFDKVHSCGSRVCLRPDKKPQSFLSDNPVSQV